MLGFPSPSLLLVAVLLFFYYNNQVRALIQCEETCGRPQITPSVFNRIVGGTICRRNSWCWQASLQKRGEKGFFHTCGGSVINNRWILTAAHCVFEMGGPEDYIVVLAEHDRLEASRSSHRITFHVQEIVIHEDYIGIGDFWRNDIALLRLVETINFSKYICPVCLPEDDSTDDIVNCWTTGWGRDQTNGKPLMKLNQVDMKYFDFETCSQPQLYGHMIWEAMICFGNLEGGRGTCQGDSGGPLVCCGRDAKHWTLRGLVSWAKGGCAAPNRPTVFTNVAQYTDWLERNIDERQ